MNENRFLANITINSLVRWYAGSFTLFQSDQLTFERGLAGCAAVCFFTAELHHSDDVGSVTGLNKLHIIGREHSEVAIWGVASPPAFIYHFDPSDDIVGVEGDLRVISWRTKKSSESTSTHTGCVITHFQKHLIDFQGDALCRLSYFLLKVRSCKPALFWLASCIRPCMHATLVFCGSV